MITEQQLLNPELYVLLKKRFGRVKIMNAGVRTEFEIVTPPDMQGKKQLSVTAWGEAYKVCCPKCGEQRFRLIINHRHRTLDSSSGLTFGPMLHCFNEKCNLEGFDDDYLKPYIYKYK